MAESERSVRGGGAEGSDVGCDQFRCSHLAGGVDGVRSPVFVELSDALFAIPTRPGASYYRRRYL